MVNIEKTGALKKRKATASYNADDSGLNLSTEDKDELFPTTDKEGTKEDANLESDPSGGHDDNVSSDSSVGGEKRGWGRGGGGGGGNGPLPAAIVDPADESILGLFKRLGIEQKCASHMINVEQFMRSSNLVSLDNRKI